MAHGVQKQWHTAATIGTLAKGMINFSRSDDRVRVRGSHPFDGGMNLVIGDLGAMTDDHS